MKLISKLKKSKAKKNDLEWVKVVDESTEALRVPGGILIRSKLGNSLAQTFIKISQLAGPADWIYANRLEYEEDGCAF